MQPRYPIYIPSKGRSDVSYTADCLSKEKIPFRLVIEPQEFDKYAKQFGKERLLVLPFSDRGSVIYARNWIKDHSISMGAIRHWQLDDNIPYFQRAFRGQRVRCSAGIALRVTEDFVDRYENIAIAGLNYDFFYLGATKRAPFFVNQHVYSVTLFLNSLPHRWRLKYNEDTDICLQVLADGWCTLLMNCFLAKKLRTMTVKGGNTAELYRGDGRLKMARCLERVWPGVAGVGRRFKRPQHIIKYQWTHFDTPLKLKPGIDLAKMKPNEYGMKLVAVAPVKSKRLRNFLKGN